MSKNLLFQRIQKILFGGSLNRINSHAHAIIGVGILYKINNFDRVDLVSNNKRKIGTQNWKTWVADKCKKEFQQKVYYQEHGINNRGKKATSYKRKIRLMLLLLGRLFLIFCSTFFWVITQQLSFFFPVSRR